MNKLNKRILLPKNLKGMTLVCVEVGKNIKTAVVSS